MQQCADLPPTTHGIFKELSLRAAPVSKPTGTVKTSPRFIAERLGYELGSVEIALEELADMGLLDTEGEDTIRVLARCPHRRPGVPLTSCVYELEEPQSSKTSPQVFPIPAKPVYSTAPNAVKSGSSDPTSNSPLDAPKGEDGRLTGGSIGGSRIVRKKRKVPSLADPLEAWTGRTLAYYFAQRIMTEGVVLGVALGGQPAPIGPLSRHFATWRREGHDNETIVAMIDLFMARLVQYRRPGVAPWRSFVNLRQALFDAADRISGTTNQGGYWAEPVYDLRKWTTQATEPVYDLSKWTGSDTEPRYGTDEQGGA